MIPVVPIMLGTLFGAAWLKAGNRAKQAVTDPVQDAQRTAVYKAALDEVKDPDKLNALAAVFAGEGLTAHADVLRRRAALHSATPEEKKARRAVYRKAMASQNVEAIWDVAQAFEDSGATGAAENLRAHAKAVYDSQEKPT
jgi:hypothetical protein